MSQIDKKILFACWSSENKNYHAYTMWDAPLRNIFKEVVTFDPQKEMYEKGKDEMNAAFLEVLKREQPDYTFIWVIYDEFYLETLAKIKEVAPNTKVINFCGDDDVFFDTLTVYLFPYVDYFFATQTPYFKDYEKEGKKVFFAAGTDTGEFKPLNVPKKYDIGFSGTFKADRLELIMHLIDSGLNVAVYSSGGDKYPELGSAFKGKPSGDRFSLTFMNECKINLCLSKNNERRPHLLERFFQISACKGFALTDFHEGYYELGFKEGHDIVTFKNKDELLEKARYYLKNEKEREQIAERAYQKTIAGFSNESLLREAFTEMEKTKKPKSTPLWDKQKNSDVLYLSSSDLNKSHDEIKKQIGPNKYVGFKTFSENLPSKEQMQTFAIEYYNKPMSCCNPYYTTPSIGDYMSLHVRSLVRLSPKDLDYALDLAMFVVKKEYFLKNLEDFRLLAKGEYTGWMTEDNTAFVNLPLVRVKKNIFPRDPEEFIRTFVPLFENGLRNVKGVTSLATRPYVYKLLAYSSIFNRPLFNYLVQRYNQKKAKKK